jgi:hypothetical protein
MIGRPRQPDVSTVRQIAMPTCYHIDTRFEVADRDQNQGNRVKEVRDKPLEC